MGIILAILVYFLCSFFVALWTSRSIDYVAALIVHHSVSTPFWIDWLVSFITGGLTIPFNIICELIRAVA